ncbi:VOC family protein [Variovorax sp. RB3P1]|uniref:VOC family protein n=1 Tax=Variovorax sp. RB3P1 TaxID=3443732 RepID=UPI003F49718C
MTNRAYQGIDHVVIRTADAASLYELFSGHLGLPVTWPLERATFATFGWIGLGNTNLEIWAAADNSDLPADCPFPLIHQIALAPAELSETLARFDAMGLSCKAPRTYSSKDELGEVRTNFTNSVILDLSNESCCVFVCDWGVEFHAILTRHFHPILTHPLCEPGGSRCG